MKPRVVAIVQARMSSTRFPGKVLEEIEGVPMFWHVGQRARWAKTVDMVAFAIPDTEENTPLAKAIAEYQWQFQVGPEDDVIERVHMTAWFYKANIVVRLTADCPFIDPSMIDQMVQHLLDGGLRFVTNQPYGETGYPGGMDVEVFTMEHLTAALDHARRTGAMEHVTDWMYNQGGKYVFRSKFAGMGIDLSVNTKSDLDLARKIFAYQHGIRFGFADMLMMFRRVGLSVDSVHV